MGAKERILTIRLLDKLKADPALAEKLMLAGEIKEGGRLCNESKT